MQSLCKAEAHRALELLENYYTRLDDAEEKELKAAIERVIKIFKSRLFQALLDIQEFYQVYNYIGNCYFLHYLYAQGGPTIHHNHLLKDI